jgi:GNAT superfamily N-acetyltransferase
LRNGQTPARPARPCWARRSRTTRSISVTGSVHRVNHWIESLLALYVPDVSDDGKTRIRFADEADAAVIARIHMTSRSAAMPYLPPQKRSHEQVTRWVRDVLLRQCRTWVAVRDAEITGYAALDGDILEHLYLRPDARRQGIGTLLLDEVRRHSPNGVSLHVFQQNTDARAFYERHGFTVFDTSDGDRNMENLPDMTLRWIPDSAR